MTRNTQNTMSRLLTVGLLVGLAGVAQGQVLDITRDDKTSDKKTLGPGEGPITIEAKNLTGQKAYDVSVSISHPTKPVPNITCVDIEQIDDTNEDDDYVDDGGSGEDVDEDGYGDGPNSDGIIDDSDDTKENDTCDSTPGPNCKSIITDRSYIDENDKVEMTITFDGPYPDGTKISVKFSKKEVTKNTKGEKVDQHSDLCHATPMDADGVLTAQVAVGPAQMSYEVVHFGSSELMELFMPFEDWPVPCVGVALPEEFEGRYTIHPTGQEEHYFRIFFDPGLLPGEAVELSVLLEEPIELLEQEFDFMIFGTFDGCIADFNGDGEVNTLDVLAFFNAWNAGEDSADINGDGEINTLDVLEFFNLWNLGC